MGATFWTELGFAALLIVGGAWATRIVSQQRYISVVGRLFVICMCLGMIALGASLVRDAVDPQGRNLLTERAYGLFMVSEEKRRWGVP